MGGVRSPPPIGPVRIREFADPDWAQVWSIVRDVVRAHCGSVSASNQAVGALFVIELPAAGSNRIAS